MRRIFDCTIIHDELDMLELRMAILGDVVDTFIVCEADLTHSGQPKPLHVTENLARFTGYGERLQVHTARLDPRDHSWTRERAHRAAIADGLKAAGAQAGDLVVVADVDEIPRPEVITQIGPQGARLELDFYYYNARTRVDEGWSIGALPYEAEADPNAIRTLAGHDVPTIDHAGVHLSYFGGADRIARKMDAFMHHADIAAAAPRDPAWIQERIDAADDLYGRGLPIRRLQEVPADLPYELTHNPRYAGWL